MAALAGAEGLIALLMAVALQQAPTPADLPALVTARIKDCVAMQIALEANPDIQLPGALWEGEALDGSQAEFRTRRGSCQILSPRWRGDGDVMAGAVRAGLEALPAVVVVRWREPMVNERGPTVWTTFERKDAAGRTIAVVRLIEPADGATGEVDIAWETPPR
jgi:hypothetical protein